MVLSAAIDAEEMVDVADADAAGIDSIHQLMLQAVVQLRTTRRMWWTTGCLWCRERRPTLNILCSSFYRNLVGLVFSN